MSVRHATVPDSVLAVRYGLDRQSDSEDEDELDQDSEAIANEEGNHRKRQRYEDHSAQIVSSLSGTLAAPNVLELLPTGKLGIRRAVSQVEPTTASEAYDDDQIKPRVDAVDSGIDGQGFQHEGIWFQQFPPRTKRKKHSPMKKEQQEQSILELRKQLNKFASPPTESLASMLSPGSLEKSAAEVKDEPEHAREEAKRLLKEEKERKQQTHLQNQQEKKQMRQQVLDLKIQKQQEKKQISAKDKALREEKKLKAQKDREEKAALPENVRKKLKEQHEKEMALKRSQKKHEMRFSSAAQRVATLEDMVVRGAVVEIFESAREWLGLGPDGPAALVELTWIESDFKGGEDGDEVVVRKVLKLLERYAAVPLGAVEC